MKLEEKNQLFIDCIVHWHVDGIHKFEDGLKPIIKKIILFNRIYIECWSDGSEFKLNGSNCPLCDQFNDECEICFLEKDIVCCKAYYDFIQSPSLERCKDVIEYLWNRCLNVTHSENENESKEV